MKSYSLDQTRKLLIRFDRIELKYISLKTYDFTVSPCRGGKGMVLDLCPVKSEHLLPLQLIIDRSPVESIVVPFIFASL